MNRKNLTFTFFLLSMMIVSGVGLYSLSRRASCPVQVSSTEGGLKVLQVSSPNMFPDLENKTLVKVDGIPVFDIRQLKTILERKSAGENLFLELSGEESYLLQLQGTSQKLHIWVSGVLAIAFFLISYLVWRKGKNPGEFYFALSALMLGSIIAIGGTGLHLPLLFTIPLNIFYFLYYPLAFFLFLMFCYHFPTTVLSEKALYLRRQVFITVSLFISILLITAYFVKVYSPALQNVLIYDYLYRGFRGVIMLILAISLVVLIRNLRREPTPENYRKVYWLLWGVVVGSAPFLLLWNLPQLLGYDPLLPAWLVTLWLVVIPASIAIAIIKHHLFDIEIILSRSIIYFTVLSFLLIGYVLLVGGLSLVVYQQFSLQSPLLSFVTALIIALAFNPVKQRVTYFVNQKFFRIRYDRFLALKSLLNVLENCYTPRMVFKTLQQQYQQVIPLSESFDARLQRNRWKIEGLPKNQKKDWEKWLEKNGHQPFPEKLINEAHQQLVEDCQSEILKPFPQDGVMLLPIGEEALWCLGKKLSGTRFWQEDVELASQMAQAAATQLEKIKYFQKSVEEAMEKERAQRLSRWKSLLVVEVAHDLRSPLNTMLWKLKNFQQTLREREESRFQPVEEMRRQIEHLQALIQALLIMPQVEEEKYRIQWQTLPLKAIVEEVLSHLEGIITGKKLQVTVDCPADLTLRADVTLLKEILLNLLDNAAKFSSPGKRIDIRTFLDKTHEKARVRILIIDEAGGIPPEQQRLIFEPFQEQDSEDGRIHLGLYIAREFTRAMGGELTLKWAHGKGTVVELYFER